jgi:hypothetical protein
MLAAKTSAESASVPATSITPEVAAPSAAMPADKSVNGFQPAIPATTALPMNALPAAPSAMIVLKKKQPEPHRFLDTTNALAISSVAAALTADALSTQKGLSLPGFYEMNPIARSFVQTRAGAAAYSAGSFGLLTGAMYMAHKTGHHKLERILPFATAGWEGLLSFRNYHVIAQHTR